ncbi:RNA 3'-terminal phosphate cyclase/enolpyruvate transferase [Coniella lustricola]|uniref:RNA 3'-terminal phosphate cyclase/enolpyruvate transferase n=1 Tax=Coniella lustricola TaxID=2025994 RepID=A0A2T3ADM6_9PEZI|nr:RNA 3'-terminal phosphate cyclase/enolpyruvate transferase [Coniella lustricola]
MIEIDGQTGEGGGQLVRIAVALASVACKPVRITNVRGNRPGGHGGGLKSQHVTAIEWLAQATNAKVKGLEVGSKTLEFSPDHGPGGLPERQIQITAASPAASALLIFQAVLPFLLFAGNARNEPVELTISGGTNVSFSLSYEYLDQVLLPTLETWFGIRVERRLDGRGWSTGRATRGSLWFQIHPLPMGNTLKIKDGLTDNYRKVNDDLEVGSIEITVIAPSDLHAPLGTRLREDLEALFPDTQLNFRQPEESGHEAHCLYSGKRKGKKVDVLCREVSRSVSKDLASEIHRGGLVDEFLQDQLVVFQALTEGSTSFPRSFADSRLSLSKRHSQVKKDRCRGPIGDSNSDSSHTQTARWVAWEILEPKLTWFNKGTVCEAVGFESGC